MRIDTEKRTPASLHLIAHAISRWNGRRAAALYGVGLVALVFSNLLAPLPGYVLILGVCVCLGLGFGALVRDSSGLRDHRQ